MVKQLYSSAQSSTFNEDSLIQSIRFLTSFLKGCSGSGVEIRSNETPRGDIDSFIHLANLLTVDTPILAITGNVTADKSIAGIFISSQSGGIELRGSISSNQLEEGFVFTDLRPSAWEPSAWETIDFTKLQETIPTIRQHAEDLLSIFRYHTELNLDLEKFCRWIVLRCYPKLRHRLLGGTTKRSWLKDPVTVMLDWSPDSSDSTMFGEYLQDEKGHYNVTLKPVDVRTANILKSFGLVLNESSSTFKFDMDSAQTWLRFICNIIMNLRDHLSVGMNSTLTPSSDALYTVDAWLHLLASILHGLQVLEWLITQSSLHRQFQIKGVHNRGKADQKEQLTKHLWIMVSSDATVQKACCLIYISDEDTNASDERNLGKKVYSNIRTLLSWYTAVRYFMPRIKYIKTVEATLVTLLDHYNAPYIEIGDLKNSIELAIDQGSYDAEDAEVAKNWFTEHAMALKSFKGHVHAEAGIMALASHYRSRNLEADVHASLSLHEIFSSEKLRRGLPTSVGKKSCWTCWWLGQKLFADKHIDIRLPGTHGTIFPWDPPVFGIPTAVLKDLVDALKKKVVQKAIHEAYLQKSTSSQSSPRSAPPDNFGLPTWVSSLLNYFENQLLIQPTPTDSHRRPQKRG
ncbi:hypothetical protein EVG20_g6061 [Dentipellis fragilis]|uniref:Uncharacterized protein n=1 Tax=Dentipellis fragilis TaxID=205917 RepID=A0A4Y9YRA5_9AGAM|nr:hypothetical protein EVG20_g6061 [Dentipellis fragilis]